MKITNNISRGRSRAVLAILVLSFASFTTTFAQTSAFTFQGKLNHGGTPTSSTFDMQFKLFDALGAGNQVGTTETITNVQTTAGIFTVQLDFGSTAFSGAERFIEIGISPAGQNDFTMLAPRQKINSVPYSVQSLNATDSSNLGGIAADQYVQTSDTRLSDARIPLQGSNHYVQDNTNTPQPSVNFNIGGTGTASILNATTQFNLGGVKMFAATGPFNDFAGINLAFTNTFAGEGAGHNTVPDPNSGLNPGKFNTFVGANAGKVNTTATQNAFFGAFSGRATTQGSRNAFFGSFAGNSNTTGSSNSYFGQAAGFNSTTAFNNAFFGSGSGVQNTTGESNAFFGASAGDSNNTGLGNTAVGASSDVGSGNLTNATAIGYQAVVTQSNSLVLGQVSTRVGIGTSAPGAKLHINGAEEGVRIQGPGAGIANVAYTSFVDATGANIGYVGDGSTTDEDLYLTSYGASVHIYTPVGPALTATATGNILMRGGPAVPLFTAVQTFDNNNGPFKGLIARSVFLDATPGNGFDNFLASAVHVCARIQTLGSGFGGYALTRCSSPFSSANDKTDIQPFSGGLNIINRLDPVSFKRNGSGTSDIGLNVEDVAQTEPLLVMRNEKGEAEEVSENGLQVVMINAIKDLETQIKRQQQEIEALKRRHQEFDALKKLVCLTNAEADICKEEQK